LFSPLQYWLQLIPTANDGEGTRTPQSKIHQWNQSICSEKEAFNRTQDISCASTQGSNMNETKDDAKHNAILFARRNRKEGHPHAPFCHYLLCGSFAVFATSQLQS
jgi:hypothetical protein